MLCAFPKQCSHSTTLNSSQYSHPTSHESTKTITKQALQSCLSCLKVAFHDAAASFQEIPQDCKSNVASMQHTFFQKTKIHLCFRDWVDAFNYIYYLYFLWLLNIRCLLNAWLTVLGTHSVEDKCTLQLSREALHWYTAYGKQQLTSSSIASCLLIVMI